MARIVPFRTDESLEERLLRLTQCGIIEKLSPRQSPLPPALPLPTGLARRMLDEDRVR